MIPDYHLHTEFSGDSAAPVRDVICQAIRLGMTELCITDHHDYDVKSDLDFTLNLPAYFDAMAALRESFQDQIDVRIGVEMGLQPHLVSYIHDLAAKYPFDFIIGSTHFIDGIDPYFPGFFQGKSEKEGYETYFHTLLTNIRLIDDYDVVGHIDYIVRYGPNKSRYYSYDAYRDVLDAILKTCIEKGKGIECNSNGYRTLLGHPNPHPDILKRYHQLGGEILTVGSDAHSPEDLGSDFDQVRRLLLECGFTYYTSFKERKPEFHEL